MGDYRADIDGLRAICIGVVVMFHAGFDDWLGGYIGVDVFFVISGFLITSLIMREMEAGSFSLLGFYERRARRLLSATVPVIAFTTLFAWTFYTTDAFLAYSKSLVAFAAYVSNWYFLATTAYFGTHPDAMPLLHTWSLAVEEQFYFIFPALLLLLSRRKALVLPALALLAAASLAYAQAEIAAGNSDRAFFSLFSRFWELMAGALLALLAHRTAPLARFSTVMRAAGLAMIVVPVFTFGPATGVPGLPTLIPVGGALLLLAASPAVQDPIHHALRSGPFVYLGKISYSLYLWHWPVFAAMRTVFIDHNDLHKVLAIAASIALAALSYHYVEQPVRTRRILPRKIDMAGLAAACIVLAGTIGAYGWTTGGWPGRFDPAVERMAAEAATWPADPNRCFKTASDPNDFCKVGVRPGEPIDLVLWGDSHAASLLPIFERYAEERGLSFAATIREDCLPLLGVWRTKDDATRVCRAYNDAALDFVRQHGARNIAFAARWQIYVSGPQRLLDDTHLTPAKSADRAIFARALERTLDALADANVLFVEQVPELQADLPASYLLMKRIGLPDSTVATTLEGHRKTSRATAEILTRLEESRRFARFDPAGTFCKQDLCTFEAGGKLLYLDNDHLNAEGSKFLYPDLAAALDEWRARRKHARSGKTVMLQAQEPESRAPR